MFKFNIINCYRIEPLTWVQNKICIQGQPTVFVHRKLAKLFDQITSLINDILYFNRILMYVYLYICIHLYFFNCVGQVKKIRYLKSQNFQFISMIFVISLLSVHILFKRVLLQYEKYVYVTL